MARAKMTPEDYRDVRDFLLDLAAVHEGGWDQLMREARVPFTTAQAWRYENPSATPSAPHLISILRAAGILEDAATKALGRSQQAAAAAAQPEQNEPHAPARRARGG